MALCTAAAYSSTGATAPTGLLASDSRSYGGASGGEVEDGTNPAPTAVTLARFEARAAGGSIAVEWETVTEIDNIGFNLYRSTTIDGAYVRLNDQLIPAQVPGSPVGAVYAWTDSQVVPGHDYYYQLEAVDVHGATETYGPVSATAAYGVYLPMVLR